MKQGGIGIGGRGTHYQTTPFHALSMGTEEGEVYPLNVVGMSPVDRGSRFTNAEKTLEFIEQKKIDYPREQLQVIDKFGYVTRAFQGDEHSVAFDMDTRQYMRGKIVTHNHPSVYGGTFSDADINTLKMGMSEMRASAKEGTYSLKAKRTARPVEFFEAYQRAAAALDKKMYEAAVKVAGRGYRSQREFEKENRRKQLDVLHQWYKKNSGDYGYEYTFIPNKEYQ